MNNNRSKVNIISFVNQLVNKTREGKCEWEETSDNNYRLLLKNGSVIFSYIKEKSFTDNYCYSLKLFDEVDCFASYQSSTYDDAIGIYMYLEDLRKAIDNNKDAIIENKIFNLSQNLENL